METMDPAAREQLESFIQRIERLNEEKSAIQADIKDVYAEAKGNGYDAKALRAVVKLRAKERHELEEEEQLLALYRAAVGV
jgi:uncharacterized protein (UPF0335 family)